MISITPQMRVLCFIAPVDFRRGIDGLLGICRAQLSSVDPFSGTLFLFRSRSRKSIKGVVYDGQGFWLIMKRLSTGSFSYWPTGEADDSAVSEILSRELSVLLWNGDPRKALMKSDFKRLNQPVNDFL
jgi:transposase